MEQRVIETTLRMMPVWFGVGFLGPVLAELCHFTPIYDRLPMILSTRDIYVACMSFGCLYGVIAWRIGRWL